MITEILAIATALSLFQVFLVMAGGFILVVAAVIFVKYFKFIFSYLMIFLFISLLIYAGSMYWPLA